MRTDQKPFVVVGNKDISPEELMALYGLSEEECYLGDERDITSYLTVGKVIRLYPRPNGDYEEHLNQVLKEDYERTGGEIVKKAKKKTRFKTDVEWAKALRKKGKM